MPVSFIKKNIWIFPGVDCGKNKNKYNPEQQVLHVCQRDCVTGRPYVPMLDQLPMNENK